MIHEQVRNTPGEETIHPGSESATAEFNELAELITHVSHLLPTQGPITVFVHHNTLHNFEHLDFDAGVKAASKVYGTQPYLSKARYRQELERGRINVSDLEAILREELGEDRLRNIAGITTVGELRFGMMEYPIRIAPDPELRWYIRETDAVSRFRVETKPSIRTGMIADTRNWVLHQVERGNTLSADLQKILGTRSQDQLQTWNDQDWEAFTLQVLWHQCREGVSDLEEPANDGVTHIRHRDFLLNTTGEDTDLMVNSVLIPFCAAFLDQGLSHWQLPERHLGFYQAFLHMHRSRFSTPEVWLARVRVELDRLHSGKVGPLESICQSLNALGVSRDEWNDFIQQTFLALRGWAGMIVQMETNAEWAVQPAPAGSTIEYLAVRLLLDRAAAEQVAHDSLRHSGLPSEIRSVAQARIGEHRSNSKLRRAFVVFTLSQVLGWRPEKLGQLSSTQWIDLVGEIECFPEIERRRIFHKGYERQYRNQALSALIHQARKSDRSRTDTPAEYQVVCCIDDREESFRRALEEVDTGCETFGLAGFFGVAMYYRGATDAHFKPLCPVVIRPNHYVVEKPIYTLQQAEFRRASVRRRWGQATHQAHIGSRTILGGVLSGLLGSLAVFPLVSGILFPRVTAELRRLFRRIVLPPMTELQIERLTPEPGNTADAVGYSVDEMANLVQSVLRTIGLNQSSRFSRLILFCGHGSSSLNNPHGAAYDCGACGGAKGGPNARAFAHMANDSRIRRVLQQRGFTIPEETYFVGAYHNTCNDSIEWFDLDSIPVTHRRLFERAKASIDETRRRNAHERCRRFMSANLFLSTEAALRHVEERSVDLSQARPECGHATNALCFVGRREWSKGLFLDRRAFLTSYDPTTDDEAGTILENLLRAVMVVCSGINLEYYFSYVDSEGYGCGTKLPHNITSLLGVMNGAASDLRPGLPWQMVEIHEPVRLLFVIETSANILNRILRENPGIAKLVAGGWVQTAIIDCDTQEIQLYQNGEFVTQEPTGHIPEVASSMDWYRGQRDHLGFATIQPKGN